MLHIVKEFSVFKHCLDYSRPKEAILLIEQGIFCLFIPELLSLIIKNQKNIIYYLLLEHLKYLEQQACKIPEIKTTIHLINYPEFVKLVAQNPKTLTWH